MVEGVRGIRTAPSEPLDSPFVVFWRDKLYERMYRVGATRFNFLSRSIA
jgi:hypothetical protein